jgi:hypothetical protein
MDAGAKRRDLEDRTFQFANAVRNFIKQLPRTLANTARELTLIFSAIISKSGGL